MLQVPSFAQFNALILSLFGDSLIVIWYAMLFLSIMLLLKLIKIDNVKKNFKVNAIEIIIGIFLGFTVITNIGMPGIIASSFLSIYYYKKYCL